MARFSPISPQDLRKLERLIGRSQAKALSRKIEARAQQVARSAARGTGSQQHAAQTEAVIVKELVTKKRAGWVNEPGKSRALLVEAKTGCLVLDSKGKAITKPKITLSSKPDINKNVFIQHLKVPGNELYVPYMYLDCNSNVTVGIGTLLPDADKARQLPFIERQSGKPADKEYVNIAFDKVQKSTITPGDWQEFRKLTSVELSEANAVIQAVNDLDDFINILRNPIYFTDFDTYPVSAKMGLLDMTYTLGAKKLRKRFKVFVPAARRRDWKLAAKESSRSTVSALRNNTVRQWFEQAARQEHFFIHLTCKKRLNQMVK
jgi:hypothetical protein